MQLFKFLIMVALVQGVTVPCAHVFLDWIGLERIPTSWRNNHVNKFIRFQSGSLP